MNGFPLRMSLRVAQRKLFVLNEKLQSLKWPDNQLRHILVYQIAPLIDNHNELKVYFNTMADAYDIAVAGLEPDELEESEAHLSANFQYALDFTNVDEYVTYWRQRAELFDEPDSRETFEKILRSSSIVCENLANHIDKFEPQTSGKRASVTFKNGTIVYRKKEYQMAKDSMYAKACAIVYEHCKRVGSSVPIKTVYEGFRNKEDYQIDELGNRKMIQHHIHDANRWAEREKLPQLFSTGGGKIQRKV
jgi:hypothetical protein